MPILYVHGVNVRSREGFHVFEPFARRYLAPEISDDPDGVTIKDIFWGAEAFDPAWGGISRPRSRFLGMGLEAENEKLAQIAALGPGTDRMSRTIKAHGLSNETEETDSGFAAGGFASAGASHDAGGTDWGARVSALLELEDDALSDVLAVMVRQPAPEDENQDATLDRLAREAALALSADDMVQNGEARSILASGDAEAAMTKLFQRIEENATDPEALAAMGLGDWVERARDRFGETATRVGNLNGYLLSVALSEARGPISDVVALFLGDVFVYLKERGEAGSPGPIQRLLLHELDTLNGIKSARGGEPLIVVSHSMGGQLIYDAVTHYLPQTPNLKGITVDFWCASASQVGFFEEAKLFHASRPEFKTGNPVPFPQSNLGAWWNVWDHNDVLSFTAHDIISGVDDESYSSGSSLISAHGAYLQTPSFYRKMASKIANATSGSV